MEKFLVAITGPTAAGKTAMSIALAKAFGTEIISADARQVYQEMKTGTARPTSEELEAVNHQLVGHLSVHEDYNAARYASEARAALDQLFDQHDVALVCGGSGLYLQALIDGIDEIPEVPQEIRKELNEIFAEKGLPWLQQEAEQSDPDWYARVDQQNPRRLMRAVEVFRHSGKPISFFQSQKSNPLPCQIIRIGLWLPRPLLYQRIDNRVDQMLQDGLWEEAEILYPLRHLQALQTVGYREFFDCMDGKIDHAEAVRLVEQNTRHYAKRQMTWFRNVEETKWFDFDDKAAVERFIRSIVG